jgi:hypothetical protein
MPRTIKSRNIPCTISGCTKTFSNRGGLKNHLKIHRVPRQHIPPLQNQTPVPEQHFANHPIPGSPIPGGFQPEGEMMDVGDDGTPRKKGERVRYHPLINGTPFSFIIMLYFIPCFYRSSLRFPGKFSAQRSIAATLGPSPP